jgi:hypothetical protein
MIYRRLSLICLSGAAFLVTACGVSTLFSFLPTVEPFATAEPLVFTTIEAPQGTFVLPPVWQLPAVPDDVLQPFAGDAPEWWNWVPIHPSARAGGEAGGGFHYLVDLAPADALTYYEDALATAGWEERMGTLTSGDFSLISVDRYDARATIYLSPYGASTLVSILVE